MVKWLYKAWLVAVITVIACACSPETDDSGASTPHTLLVYVGGDNNLSAESHDKIAAIASSWNGAPHQKLLVYHDPADAAPSLIEITGHNTRRTIATYPEENSASGAVFARVIKEMQSLYPSNSYGLLLFSHASGWLPKGTLLSPRSAIASPIMGVAAGGIASSGGATRSVVIDGTAEMELADFAAAIPDGVFDYIVFEACFMAGVEVAYELRNKAPYIVASSAEIVSPGFTAIYPQAIGRLFASPADLAGFTSVAFNYFNAQSDYMRSATFSVIRTAGLEPLSAFISSRCDLDRAVDISDIQHFDRYSYRLFFDFEDYYSRLLDTDAERAELTRLIADCVVWKAATLSFLAGYGGFAVTAHSGLTTFIRQSPFPALNAAYIETDWSTAIGLDADY